MKRNGLKVVVALCIATLSAIASAAPFTGVTAITSFSSPGFQDSVIDYVVDGSGLTSYTTGATHAAASFVNAFVAIGFPRGSMRFDLGDVFDVDGMAIWNFNGSPSAGINGVTIASSIDGVSFSPIPGAPTNFKIGAASAPELAELFSFTTTARYISFNVTSNHSSPGPAIGFSEVMFTGNKVAEAPVPATLVLVAMGLTGLGWSRREKA